jgi:hypothetical protein
VFDVGSQGILKVMGNVNKKMWRRIGSKEG